MEPQYIFILWGILMIFIIVFSGKSELVHRILLKDVKRLVRNKNRLDLTFLKNGEEKVFYLEMKRAEEFVDVMRMVNED